MEVYLIRHTTPDIEKGICYGQTDIAINENVFEQELQLIKNKLDPNIEAYFSSPLQRCSQLAQRLDPNFITDDRLKELNFGDWEYKSWNDIPTEALNVWMQDFVNVRPPNGENYLDLHQRTNSFLGEILKKGHQKVALITHAGNMRSIISFVLSLPLDNSFRIRLDYAAVVKVIISEKECNHQLVSIQNQ